MIKLSLCEKCPNTEFLLVLSFPAFGLNTLYLSVFSPNAGKHGPEKTPYLDTFHAVCALAFVTSSTQMGIYNM